MSGLGHNNPPEDASIEDRLKEDHAELCGDLASAIISLEKLPEVIATETDNATATDALVKLRDVLKKVEATREEEKRPYLEAGRGIDSFFKRLNTSGQDAQRLAQAKVAHFLRKKEEAERKVREAAEAEARRKAEQAAREAEEARLASEEKQTVTAAIELDHAEAAEQDAAIEAARAAAATRQASQEKPRTTTKNGASSSVQMVWDFKIEDISAIPLDQIRPYLKRADIEKAIRAFAKSGRHTLEGVRFFEVPKATIRKG